ncbi:MAG: SurA N-terminal domain-containing protein [Desulfovibrionaceae bacterium]
MLDFFRNSINSWWVRSLFIAIILIFVFLGFGSNASNTQVLAEINGNVLSVHSFLQALDAEKKQYLADNPSLTDEILEQLGIRTQVFNRLVMRTLFIQEATKLGIFATSKEIQQTLLSLPFFKNEQGHFDSELYKKALQNNKTAVLLFEQELSDDVLIDKFVRLITGVAFVNEKDAKVLYNYFNEERSFQYLLFPKKNYLKEIVLSDEEIQEYYDRNSHIWKQPRQLSFNYIPLTKEILLSRITVSSEEVIKQYEENINLYNTVAKEIALERIKEQFLQEKMNALIEAYLDKIHISISEGKHIQDIAKELNIALEKTDFLTEEQALIRLGVENTTFTRLLKNESNSIETIPLKKEGEYTVVQVQERIPENIPPLEEVEKDVFHALQDEKSLELAQFAAIKALKEATENNAILPSFATTPLFSRLAEIPEPFSHSKELSDALFNNPKNTLLSIPYPYSDGVALIKIAHIAPAYEKNWDEDKINFTRRVLELKQREFLNLMEQYLNNKAHIVIKLPHLLKSQDE